MRRKFSIPALMVDPEPWFKVYPDGLRRPGKVLTGRMQIPLIRFMSRANSLGRRAAGLWGGLLFCFLLPLPARAQIVAPAGRTLFNQAVMVRSLIRLDSFDEQRPGERLRRFSFIQAEVWGVLPRLSLSLVTPVVRLHTATASAPGGNTTGSGDTTMFARYDWLRRNVPRGFTRLSPEIGLRLPSGGAFSDGSTDVIGSLIFSHIRDANWLVADTQLTINGEGDGGRRRGHLWRADLAYLHRLHPRDGPGVPSLFLVLELNGERRGFNRISGNRLPDSGGDLLFFSPGMEWVASKRLVLEWSVPIPVFVNLVGLQPKPSVRVMAGMRVLF